MRKLLYILFMCAFLAGCTGNNKPVTGTNADSTALVQPQSIGGQIMDSLALTALVRKMYIWHEASFGKQEDFPPEPMTPPDTLVRRLNRKLHDENVMKLTTSGFFSDEFIKNYEIIETYIDNKLKDGSARWIAGDLPPFPGYESDPWCNCQDFPNDWNWNKIVVKNLSVTSDGIANFIWDGGNKFTYKVSAIKLNGEWKIRSLAGFGAKSYLLEE